MCTPFPWRVHINSELQALQAILFQLRWRCKRYPGQVSLACSGVPTRLANALFLTCSNATLTTAFLGTSVDLVPLFAFALLCRLRPFLETETVWGPSTSMISRTCHTWITSPPATFKGSLELMEHDCVFRGDQLKVIFCSQMKYHLVTRNGVFNQVQDLLLMHVTLLLMGVETVGGVMTKLTERNTTTFMTSKPDVYGVC